MDNTPFQESPVLQGENPTENTKSSYSKVEVKDLVGSSPNTKPIRLAPLGWWLSLLLIAALAGMVYGYLELNKRLKNLETQMTVLTQTTANLPTATLNAILNFQNNNAQEQQQQAQRTLEEQMNNAPNQAKEVRGGNALKTELATGAVVGDEAAELVLIEFSDFNCPYCARFHAETLPKIKSNFVETGKIRYVYRDYIGVGGETSLNAAIVAECSRQQIGDESYIAMLSQIYQTTGAKRPETVLALAPDFGANVDELASCVDEKLPQAEIRADTQAAQQLGIRGTPGFVLGYADAEGKVQGINLQGALPYEVFERYINSFLAEAN
ncbi:MAG: thioredoxin domain-containing protein [Deinococcales bacterium]